MIRNIEHADKSQTVQKNQIQWMKNIRRIKTELNSIHYSIQKLEILAAIAVKHFNRISRYLKKITLPCIERQVLPFTWKTHQNFQ